MQVLASGVIPVKEAVEYICNLQGIESILFGASTKDNIKETASLIHECDSGIFKYSQEIHTLNQEIEKMILL